MPALTQSQVQSLPDVIATDRFTINFGSIPTFGDTSTTLLLKCIDVAIPGTDTQKFDVPLGNVTRTFRGKKLWSGGANQMALAFIETVDMTSLQALRQWLEYIVGTNSGNSQGYISSYAVTPIIQVYDTTGSISDTITLYRCYPNAIQDVPLSTQGTQQMLVQAQFSFDYAVYSNTPVT
ncbi:MAG: hypothetical protein KGH75_03860 [Rhodospirillales bacterium]|nr:hypothetical protein [Rhodospirillales bacterium]